MDNRRKIVLNWMISRVPPWLRIPSWLGRGWPTPGGGGRPPWTATGSQGRFPRHATRDAKRCDSQENIGKTEERVVLIIKTSVYGLLFIENMHMFSCMYIYIYVVRQCMIVYVGIYIYICAEDMCISLCKEVGYTHCVISKAQDSMSRTYFTSLKNTGLPLKRQLLASGVGGWWLGADTSQKFTKETCEMVEM